MNHRIIIGLMSGTSVDGIDAAIVRIGGPAPHWTAQLLYHVAVPWPKALRQRLLAIMAPADATTQELCRLNALVAEQFARAAEIAIAGSAVPRGAITAIASHGQTVCHLPPAAPRRRKAFMPQKNSAPCTLQLGDPSIIATRTGIMTVGNFRPADMAVGGQGAPLVPWADAMLFTHPSRARCVQNIGGIANVTYLPAHDAPDARSAKRAATSQTPRARRLKTQDLDLNAILAFDTGPGNMLIDAVVSMATGGSQTFDRNGRIAGAGVVDEQLLRRWQRHPYFHKRPPKSTGREEFGVAFAEQVFAHAVGQSVRNIVATITRLTAWSIAEAYRRFLPAPPREIILCGGGADNPVLIAMLTQELLAVGIDATLSRIDDHGIANKAKEAASFALLGAATLDRVPANLPSVTGAARPVILGVVAPASLES